MPSNPMGEPSWRIGPKLAGLFLVLVATLCWSAPRTPLDVNEVLERLVVKAADPSTALLRGYQKAVGNAPADVRAVGDLARLYFDLAGESGDPRYVGYAEALINRYPAALPAELLFVRGLLRQYRHAFAEAQQDFAAVLASKPDFLEAQGWRGAIFLVQADYANAKLACDALGAAGAGEAAGVGVAAAGAVGGVSEPEALEAVAASALFSILGGAAPSAPAGASVLPPRKSVTYQPEPLS